MKRVLLILAVSYFMLAVPSFAAKAASPTPEATGSSQTLGEERREQIKELRERVATRVAELRAQTKKGWMGTIKSISGKNLTLTTKQQGDKIILTNDETSFFRSGAGAKKTIKFTDLAVGQEVAAFGQVDQNTGQMTAKLIIAKVLPLNINGKVMAVDVSGGTITVQTPKNGSYIVDIETTTKIMVWEKGKGLVKFGLSKIKVNDRVHVNGIVPTKAGGANRITANRILVLPGQATGITGSPKPSASPSASPSSSPSPSASGE